MTEKTITEITRERYETGAYGRAHFAMTRETLDGLLAEMPAPTPARAFDPGPLGGLLSIPVRIDPDLPESAWRLVDNVSGEVLHEGSTAGEARREERSTDGQ